VLFSGACGVPVVDTDDLARRVVEPGRPALEQVRQAFGPGVVAPDGALRREELARRVFADPAALKQLDTKQAPGACPSAAGAGRNSSNPLICEVFGRFHI
jgi:dephospho-CoA kinase